MVGGCDVGARATRMMLLDAGLACRRGVRGRGWAALLGERIAANAGEPAVGEGLGAGVLERHEREAAEPEFAAASADDEPLYPSAGAGRLDVEVEAIAVTVAPGLCYIADEGGRQGVVRLPAAGLGGPGSCREFHFCQYSP